MILITEQCLRTLDQEPGGQLCSIYKYRIKEKSLKELVLAKNGIIVVELLSNRLLLPENLAEFFRIDPRSIIIEKKDIPPVIENPF